MKKLIALLLLISPIAPASELPGPVLPEGVGVNIHFVRGHEKELDMITAAGFKWVRMDFAWDYTEHDKGHYDWAPYDELTAKLEKRGLRAIYILDYSNKLYEETVNSRNALTQEEQRDVASPQHPESIAAYARWAAAAAAHFQGKQILWEIWNEPNGFFWKPAPNATQYSELAMAAAKAIRVTEPKATIIGPALSGFDWAYFETFFQSGILKYLDAVSVHPYRSSDKVPESAATDYERLRKLIEKYAPEARKKMPILSGEWGYTAHDGACTPEMQAAFLVRQQLSNLYHGVPLSIWYDWKNDDGAPNDKERNFGTVKGDLTPKPAYIAIRTMTRQLSGCRILRRIEAGEKNYILVCCDDTHSCKLAAWTTDEPHVATVDYFIPQETFSPVQIEGVDGLGNYYKPGTNNGRLVLDLGPLPKYIKIK